MQASFHSFVGQCVVASETSSSTTHFSLFVHQLRGVFFSMKTQAFIDPILSGARPTRGPLRVEFNARSTRLLFDDEEGKRVVRACVRGLLMDYLSLKSGLTV